MSRTGGDFPSPLSSCPASASRLVMWLIDPRTGPITSHLWDKRGWLSMSPHPTTHILLHPPPQIKTQVLLHSLEDVSRCEEMSPDRHVRVRSAGQCPPCPPLSARSVNSATCLAFACLLLVTSLLKMVPKHMLKCRLVSLSTGKL